VRQDVLQNEATPVLPLAREKRFLKYSNHQAWLSALMAGLNPYRARTTPFACSSTANYGRLDPPTGSACGNRMPTLGSSPRQSGRPWRPNSRGLSPGWRRPSHPCTPPPKDGRRKSTPRTIAGTRPNRYPQSAAQLSFLTVRPPGNGRLHFCTEAWGARGLPEVYVCLHSVIAARTAVSAGRDSSRSAPRLRQTAHKRLAVEFDQIKEPIRNEDVAPGDSTGQRKAEDTGQEEQHQASSVTAALLRWLSAIRLLPRLAAVRDTERLDTDASVSQASS